MTACRGCSRPRIGARQAIVLLVADIEQAASVGVLSPAAGRSRALLAGGLTLVLPQRPTLGCPPS